MNIGAINNNSFNGKIMISKFEISHNDDESTTNSRYKELDTNLIQEISRSGDYYTYIHYFQDGKPVTYVVEKPIDKVIASYTAACQDKYVKIGL